ncbi:MAG: GerMN domain-containing protein [Lachnospiraceae bacterium]|nr:GerMN domain-containing protein [Lachnospiraceae bacterium]
MKKWKHIFLLLLLALTVTGCSNGNKGEEESGYFIYYLNTDGTKIEQVSYKPSAQKGKAMANELLKQFTKMPSDGKQTALPSTVKIKKHVLEKRQLTLYFDKDAYEKMNSTREVLARAALVRTVTQCPDVESVLYYVDDTPLRNKSGNYVGVMTADTFVENVGQQINSISKRDCTLYYASKDGKHLVKKELSVHEKNNVSSEKMVMELLGDSDVEGKYQSVIPAEAKLVSVTTVDGVCLVVFDEGFLKANYNISNDVVIYSIVDSLCELPNVSKVQISINGETGVKFRDSISLDEVYERNLDLLLAE